MKLHALPKSLNRNRKRVGRGESSGLGKTSGKGNKGAKARSGYRVSPVTSGIPWYRKLPIRGFSNFRFRADCAEVTLRQIASLMHKGVMEINLDTLRQFSVIGADAKKIKVIGKEVLPRAITVHAHQFSKGAADSIVGVGGVASVISSGEVAPKEGVVS
ncbi:MAG: 50S ribosomal protein L15 [Puniceicoccales bacterium]|jgi:large subunit ribosomal protein L15|nr:50S ribosomal protein L15 [Puniceicoccales bacterium]